MKLQALPFPIHAPYQHIGPSPPWLRLAPLRVFTMEM